VDGGRKYIDLLRTEWAILYDLCSSFTDDQWHSETELPGWTVKDVMAHITGTESWLLGRPPAAHSPPPAEHVKNPIGERNEMEVDYRRSKPGQQVLDEFHEVTTERAVALDAMTEDALAADSWTPVGPGTVADLLAIRVVDAWVHEQDIRRAVGRPGHLDGPVADHCFTRLASAMPYVVGKKVKPPDGSTVIFDVNGPPGGELAVTVEDGRARELEDIPREADVRLAMDLQTFTCLSCGRWGGREALGAGLVQLDGDTELGRRVVEAMNFML
jgi:uncharacterized protein (TIGR03083 family)